MRVCIIALFMLFSTSSAFAEQTAEQRLCAHYGKSAMLVSVHKLMGDSKQKQIDVLAKLKIENTEAGEVIADIIELVYSPEQNINTKDDVGAFGLKVYNTCMELPKR